MIVVDASAVLEVLLGTPAAATVAARMLAVGEALHAPHVLDLEVAQVLRRYERTGALSATRGAEALDDLTALPVTRWPHDPLLPRVWDLRRNVTSYDAAYLALAEALDAPLLTRDRALIRVPGCRARVALVR